MQRTKGSRGELEVAALIQELTGWEVRRKVRQHAGDSDLDGVPGWRCEIKRHAKISGRSQIESWWRQAVSQAEGHLPVLFYRADRDSWRAVWPAAINLTQQRADYWQDYNWTAETSVECWAAVARELAT